MQNCQVDTMSDFIPASIRPLVKKSFGGSASGDIGTRTTIDDNEPAVFAQSGEWSMQLVQKLHFLSQMTKGNVAWAHRV